MDSETGIVAAVSSALAAVLAFLTTRKQQTTTTQEKEQEQVLKQHTFISEQFEKLIKELSDRLARAEQENEICRRQHLEAERRIIALESRVEAAEAALRAEQKEEEENIVPTTHIARILAQAFAVQEGWFNPNSAQHKNNNPGNLMDIAYFKKTGQFRLAVFQTMRAGWDAQASLIQHMMLDKKLSLYEFLGGQRYASSGALDLKKGTLKQGGYPGYCPFGHGANDPIKYADFVAKLLSIPADVPLSKTQPYTLTGKVPEGTFSG